MEAILRPGQDLKVTALSSTKPPVQGRVMEVLGPQVRVAVESPIAFGAPVKLESNEILILGDVCYCERTGDLFTLGVTARHKLEMLPELANLNRVLTAPAVVRELAGNARAVR